MLSDKKIAEIEEWTALWPCDHGDDLAVAATAMLKEIKALRRVAEAACEADIIFKNTAEENFYEFSVRMIMLRKAIEVWRKGGE